MGDAYGTGIVEKLTEEELTDGANQKRVSSTTPANKKETEEV